MSLARKSPISGGLASVERQRCQGSRQHGYGVGMDVVFLFWVGDYRKEHFKKSVSS